MTLRQRQLPLSVYLFLCLLLGGSAQAIWGNLVLQLLGLALLAWAAMGPAVPGTPARARVLLVLAALALLLLLLQLVPLPPAIWSALPGRGFVAEGLTLVGEDAPWMPLSLAPHSTLAAGFALIIPFAVLAVMIRHGAYSNRWLVIALLAGTFAGCLLGVLQVGSGGSKDWYLYRFSAFGQSTGFFANSNSMGTLLLAAAPFLVALAIDRADAARSAQTRATIKISAAAAAALLAVSVLLNGSLAVQLLAVPVGLACAASLAWGRQPQQRKWIAIGALIALAAAIATAVIVKDRVSEGNAESFSTRSEIWATTISAVNEMGAAGSGVGTFAALYPRFEDPAAVTTTFINNAHNDYLELALETGVAGAVLLLLFLLWWGAAAVRCWGDPLAGPYARAASIASATILLHSLVDYPLRTAAIAALFAVTLSMMALRSSRPAATEKNELRPSRHRSID